MSVDDQPDSQRSQPAIDYADATAKEALKDASSSPCDPSSLPPAGARCAVSRGRGFCKRACGGCRRRDGEVSS